MPVVKPPSPPPPPPHLSHPSFPVEEGGGRGVGNLATTPFQQRDTHFICMPQHNHRWFGPAEDLMSLAAH